MSSWPDPELTVERKVGIGTETPNEALDVIGNIAATGDIAATNLNLNNSLTINQNLTVSGNFQLGTLAVNKFSSDGNLADNSNLAIPTEQAVKTYVDNQIKTRAALNGAADEDFATNNLSVDDSLTVSNGISTKQLSVSDAVTGSLTIENDLTVGNAIATRQLRVSDTVTGSLTIENDLTVGNAIATQQLSVSGSVTGSLTIENDLTVNNAIATKQLTVSDTITGSLTVENDLTVGNAIATKQLTVSDAVTRSLTVENDLTVANAIATKEVNASGTIQANRFEGDGSALTGINTGKWSDGSSDSIYYNRGNVGIGANNPTAKLEVRGTNSGGYFSVTNTGNTTAYGVRSIASGNENGTKYGLYGQATGGTSGSRFGIYGYASGGGTKYGLYGQATGGTSGSRFGVYGYASSGTSGNIYGVRGHASGGTSGSRFGIYGYASGGGTKYGGYFSANNTGNTTAYGVRSIASGNENGTKYGLYGQATGGTSGSRFGVYGYASGGSTRYAGYFAGDVRVTGRLFVNNVPYGDRRNVQWDSSSRLFYQDNSSRTTKENITSLEDDFTKILQVAPKIYTRPGDTEHWEIGYIAEEFHELGLNQLIYYDEDGSPGAINYRKISMYLVEIVKELEKKLQQYERRLNQLENSH